MKKICFALILLFSFFCFISCGMEKSPNSDATITLTDGNGEKTDIDVDEETAVSSYRIIRSDTASQSVRNIAADIRRAILEKTGEKLDLVTDYGTSSGEQVKEIVVGETKDPESSAIAESLGRYDYTIKQKGNKLYIIGGSEDSLAEAAALFIMCFIYEDNKSILLPVEDGYDFVKKFAFDKLTADGVDIAEFSIYAADTESVDNTEIKTNTYAEELSAAFADKLIGKKIPIAKEMGEGHYIVLSAVGLDADGYSVRLENGNIYIEGSFVSIDAAYNAFISEMLGYKEDGELSRTLKLTSEDNISGSLGFTVPYTKQDLLDLFSEASDSKDMVISGSHVYKGSYGSSWVSNTSNAIFKASGKRPAILELDVGRHSVYYDYYTKGNTITPYDLSAFVSESAEHVSKGGIISVCIHMANPLMNASDNVWYRGHLGSEDMARDMLTDGTEMNQALRKTLESTFMLIKALDDNGIPFIFRPLHEMNGGWFWWCVNQGEVALSQETMQDFWKFFYKVVTEEMGIENALWVYAPNYNNGGCADVLYAYPGDEYVDIVGCDWYTNGNYEVNNNDSFTKIMSTGKPSALTEVGPASGGALSATDADGKIYYTWTCEDLLSAIKDMIRDDFKVSYFLTWTGKMSIAGLGNADILMNDEIILTLDDLMSRCNDLK
ncbi:MAG: hypothetical protein IJZ89_02100 [Clostridia bacterium]|nr:hypothetical protein [Clostridia bacterium]